MTVTPVSPRRILLLALTRAPDPLVPAGCQQSHQVLKDGETHYSPGHFAHIARTDSGIPFHNVTIELVRPQGTPKNLCRDVLPGTPLNCPEPPPAGENNKAKKGELEPSAEDVPYFERTKFTSTCTKCPARTLTWRQGRNWTLCWSRSQMRTDRFSMSPCDPNNSVTSESQPRNVRGKTEWLRTFIGSICGRFTVQFYELHKNGANSVRYYRVGGMRESAGRHAKQLSS